MDFLRSMKIDRGGDDKDKDDGNDNDNGNGNDSAFVVLIILAACKVCKIGRRVSVIGRRMIISWVLGGSC